MPKALTEAEVAQFHEQGFLIPRFRFSEADAARLHAGVMRIVESNPDLRNKPITTAHMPRPTPGGGDASLMEWCAREEILDMIEDIDGEDLLLWTTSVFHKPAVDGVGTPWHQDGQYWPMQPVCGTSAWVATTPSNKRNGCLRVLPGTHKALKPHVDDTGDRSLFKRVIDPTAFNEADAVDVELEPGQMVLVDSMIAHGAQPNTSKETRTGFVMRYMPTHSFFNHEGGDRPSGPPPYADRALFLMRGIDRCGRNDFTRNHV